MTWVANNTGDLAAAIEYFHSKLPGWWFSVGVCHASADATVAPDSAGCDAGLLKRRFFDEGFSLDLLPPATMADALRSVTDIAVYARAEHLSYNKSADFSGSLDVGYQEIRSRVAAGGEGWKRGEI